MRVLKIDIVMMAVMLINILGRAASPAEDAGNGILQVRQIPGSEESLKKYFADLSDCDSIYAILLPPSNCPRCDGMVTPLFEALKAADPTVPTILISAYYNRKASEEYSHRMGFAADYTIYDTDDSYKDFLSFNAGYLHIPYLLKIKPRIGEMVAGMPAEDNSDDFIRDFCSLSEPFEKKLFKLSDDFHGRFLPPSSTLEIKGKYGLCVPDSIRMSEIIYTPELYGDRLFVNDKLRESVSYFEKPEGENDFVYRAEIKTDSLQGRTFVEIPDDYYRKMLSEHSVRFIPLTPKMINDSTLAISYSLPRIWNPAPGRVAYMNMPSLLFVNPDSLDRTKVVPFRPDSDDYFYEHFYIFRYGDGVAVPCRKITWPLSLEKEEYSGNPQTDPFMKEYYRQEIRSLAVFDADNCRIKGYAGTISDMCSKTLTGSYFMQPVADTWRDKVVLSDGFSGKITIMNHKDPTDIWTTQAFEIQDDILPVPDSALFYSYDCVAPYAEIFNRNIVDIAMNDEYIYCIVRYGKHGDENAGTDDYSMVRISRSCDCREEKRFPPELKGVRSYYGLRRNRDGGVEPYMIAGDRGEWRLYIFDGKY